MLVLAQKLREFIISEVPEGTIKIHVMKISGNVVKIGIEAPPNIKIYRKEQFTDKNTCPLSEYQKTLC